MNPGPSRGPRVAVVDDQRMVLQGLTSWLSATSSRLTVVAACTSWPELLAHPEYPVDVVLLDLDLGDDVPLSVKVAALRAAGSAVVVVSSFADPARVRAAVEAGVHGYVPKAEDARTLVGAVLDAAAGRRFLTPELARLLVSDSGSHRPALSPQESRALVLYASDVPLKSVARQLGVGYETAKSYIDRVREKYEAAGRGARTKLELHRRAVEDGWLEPPRR